jgi:hypothetical protein
MKCGPIFAACIAAFTLSACGSATDAVSFTAPPGFHTKASLGPFMQMWQGKDERELLILMALPVQGDLNKAMSESDLKDADAKKITICGDQAAMFAQGVGHGHVGISGTTASTSTEPTNIEVIATVVRGKTYLAMYSRPLKAPADPAAEKAIKDVCPK